MRDRCRFWLWTVTILLAGVCRTGALEATHQGVSPVSQFACMLPQAGLPVDPPPGNHVVSLGGLDQPIGSALLTSTGCWPSLGGICVYGSQNCRNDCGARYNTCNNTA